MMQNYLGNSRGHGKFWLKWKIWTLEFIHQPNGPILNIYMYGEMWQTFLSPKATNH